MTVEGGTYPSCLFVWTWLPGHANPVVAGAVTQTSGDQLSFTYDRSYLSRVNALALGPELPLREGVMAPPAGLTIAGCLRDGSPDAWGRRVVEARIGMEENTLPERGYMLESGSDRFGAIDFQFTASEYAPRATTAALDELHTAADLLLGGDQLPTGLGDALVCATPIGGARPKVLVTVDGTQWIAKLAAPYDLVLPAVQAEAAAYSLARAVGLPVPETRLIRCRGKRVLLVRRFDRERDSGRVHALSALTLLQLDEFAARYATYPDIVDRMVQLGAPPADVRDLFTRIVFNVAISNNDDHARNHAFFWDGANVRLTPAYDLAPGPRTGHTANQAMAIDSNGRRESTFANCVNAAHIYGLTRGAAREIVERTVDTVRAHWTQAADEAELTTDERHQVWGRQILNPGTMHS